MPRLSPDRKLPTAITNLRLGTALRQCGTITVEDGFDKSTASCLYVYDKLEERYSDWTDSEPEFISRCFVVGNPSGLIVVLLPLDNKIVTGVHITRGGICDCLILTEKELSFVEFKTNVTSTNNNTLTQRADDAIGQLWNTYENIVKPRCCKALNNHDLSISVDFHVVFDKDLNVTGVSAELMDKQTDFIEDKKLPLFFDNEKVFI